MTSGHVFARRAIVPVRLRGADGAELDVDAILDTGYTEFLTLPHALLHALGLPRRDTIRVILADGSQRWADEHEGRVLWEGRWRPIPIQASDGDALLGMALLHDTLVSLEVVENGSVAIEPLA